LGALQPTPGVVPLTVFIYDRGQMVWQFDALVDEGFGLISSNDLSHRYLWGPGVDMLLADERVDWGDEDADGDVLWALADHLGSIRDWVDSEGTVVDHAVFDSFGNRLNADAIDAVFEWTGVYRDPVTGLQWNRARWYNPEIQRWMSEDFIWDGYNKHAYVGNAPTMYVDPRGTVAEEIWLIQQGVQERQLKKEEKQAPTDADNQNVESMAARMLEPPRRGYNLAELRQRFEEEPGMGPRPKPQLSKERERELREFEKMRDLAFERRKARITSEGKKELERLAQRFGVTRGADWFKELSPNEFVNFFELGQWNIEHGHSEHDPRELAEEINHGLNHGLHDLNERQREMHEAIIERTDPRRGPGRYRIDRIRK
jgi:RHS repeat-associated protein